MWQFRIRWVTTRQQRVVRHYATAGRKPGLLATFIENVRQGMEKNKDMQNSLQKLQQEASRLGQSRMLLVVRTRLLGVRLFVGRVMVSSFTFVRHQWDHASHLSAKFYRNTAKSQPVEQAMKSTADTLKKQHDELSKTEAYKTVSKGFTAVKTELLDDIAQESQPYQSPEVLLKRSDPVRATAGSTQQSIAPNEDAKNVVVHRHNKILSFWKKLRESNPFSNAFYTAKMRYDESDNILVRASRVVTDRVEDAVVGTFSQSDMAAALTEIARVDPSFNKESFVVDLQYDIIPTVLEAFLKGKLEILKDWCHEAAYNVLKAHIDLETMNGARVLDSSVIDIRHVDILAAKLLDQGPVFVVTFVAQQLIIVRDGDGGVVKGDELDINNVQYVWAMCRDQSIANPKTAWRVSEFAIHSENKLLI